MMLVRWRLSVPMPSGGGPSMMFAEAHTRGPRILPFFTPFALGDDPFDGIVGNIRAGDDAVGEINFAHPIAVVTVAVDQTGENAFALGIDHFGALRNRDVAALADSLNAAVQNHHRRIFQRRAAGPVDQSSADDGDGLGLTPRDSSGEAEEE